MRKGSFKVRDTRLHGPRCLIGVEPSTVPAPRKHYWKGFRPEWQLEEGEPPRSQGSFEEPRCAIRHDSDEWSLPVGPMGDRARSDERLQDCGARMWHRGPRGGWEQSIIFKTGQKTLFGNRFGPKNVSNAPRSPPMILHNMATRTSRGAQGEELRILRGATIVI